MYPDWSIKIYENAGITDMKFGSHFNFFHGDPEFGDLNPSFSSPHVDVLPESEVNRAYARMSALIRLASGLNLLIRGKTISYSNSLQYYYDQHDRFKTKYWKEDIDLTIEEINNPFDPEVVEHIIASAHPEEPRNIFMDYTDLVVHEPLVRESVMLLALSEEQVLYLLINTYKIMENIKSDLKLKVNNGKLVKTDESPDVPEFVMESLNNYFKYSLYINTRYASGIFARHGGNQEKQIKINPTLSEVRSSLLIAMNNWLKFKLTMKD